MNKYYFDYAAATPVDQRVLKKMEPYWYLSYGNPSSLHEYGRQAKKAIEDSRKVVAEVLGVASRNIYFTSGGTESDNLAIFGVTNHIAKKGKIIISAIEHKAVSYSVDSLQREGWEVEICPVDEKGRVDDKKLMQLVDAKTVLLSVVYANNEIGVVQDIAKLAKIAKNKNPNVYFHTDACQAVNFLEMDVKKLGVDLLSFSSSKIYGPKGVGVLYVNGDIISGPMIWGGGQERGMRSGTENVSGIVGLAEALQIARKIAKAESRRLYFLREKIISNVLKDISDVVVNGDRENRLPNNINFSFAGVEGESLVLYLDHEGFMVSTGSACGASDLRPSHVLLALGQSEEMAHGSLRISLGRWSSEEAVDKLLKILPKIVAKIRKMSATYKN